MRDFLHGRERGDKEPPPRIQVHAAAVIAQQFVEQFVAVPLHHVPRVPSPRTQVMMIFAMLSADHKVP